MTDTPSTAEERLHAWVDRRPVYNGYDDFRTDVAALLSRVESLEAALRKIAGFADDAGYMATARTLHYDLVGWAREALRAGSPRGEEGGPEGAALAGAGASGRDADRHIASASSPDGAPPNDTTEAGATADAVAVVESRRLPIEPGDGSDVCHRCGIRRENAGYLVASCGSNYRRPGCFVLDTEPGVDA